jgi:hypothetical protein
MSLAEQFHNMLSITQGDKDLRSEATELFRPHIAFTIQPKIESDEIYITVFNDISLLYTSTKHQTTMIGNFEDKETFIDIILKQYSVKEYTIIFNELSKHLLHEISKEINDHNVARYHDTL